jgi:hypothetical protein
VTATSITLEDTSGGKFTRVDASNEFIGAPLTGIADGLVVTDGATLTLEGARIRGITRAGILFDDASGSLGHVTVLSGKFGLVLQGSRQPTWDRTTFFTDAEKPLLTDGPLAVPNGTFPAPTTK